MVTLSSADQVRALLDRFGGFFDAVLVQVHLALPRESAGRHAVIRLLAQEPVAGGHSHDGWRFVVLRIDGLDAYRLTEGPDSYLVLSDGLQIRLDEGRSVIDLSPRDRWPEQTTSAMQSDQFVSGVRCSYKVEDVCD